MGVALAAPGLAAGLAGCAAPRYTATYPPPPEHFAHHDRSHPLFDLHWSVERRGDRAVVGGIVTASRASAVQDVTVEAVGLDPQGRVVSRGLGTTFGGRLSQWQSRPFEVRLRPSGGEAAFAVRVWHFRWETGPDGGARSGGR